MSGELPESQLTVELQALVEQELARTGTRATLRRDGNAFVLRRGARETRADIQGTLLQWESLPDDLRARRVRQIAELLASDEAPSDVRPAQAARAAHAVKRTLGLEWYSGFAPLAIAVLTLGAILVAYRYLAPRGLPWFGSTPSASASGPAHDDADRERYVLASTACEQTRRRVAQGANVGPADSEGWVVELSLLRHGAPIDLSRVAGLSKFIMRQSDARVGKISWAPAAHLAATDRFDAQVAINPGEPLGSDRVSGLDLIFSGPYVLPYFKDDQRSEYLNLADALADEIEASEGALFARCVGSESHHIGAWFLGATPARATASLIYFMASFSDAALLKPNVLGAAGSVQRGHAFDTIDAATASLTRNAAATLVGRELGMISGRPEHGTRLTFPFRDANRATRASVIAARALDLANPD